MRWQVAALACLCACLVLPAAAQAQTERGHEPSFWAGLMTDWALRGAWSLWFDTHYDTEAFVVLRGGVTYHFERGPTLTAGYARLWTDPGNGGLSRDEHRPWAQTFFPFTFSDRWSVTHRLRFDLRIREKVQEGAPVEGWITVPRFRSQTAASYWLPDRRLGRWFVQTAFEVLFNSGRYAGPNYLDQTRLSLMLGWRTGPVTVRTGYLDRIVPASSGQTITHEHNAVLWLSYTFRPAPERAIVPPEESNP